MPKKKSSMGENSKAVESRERKANQKQEETDKKDRAKEDAYWEDNEKHTVKKQQRKENSDLKRQETLAKKQEAKALLEEEEAKLPSKTEQKKVTRADLDVAKERERAANEELAKRKKLEQAKISENPVMDGENPNVKMARMLEETGAVEARSVGEAISVLSIRDSAPASASVDRHPEKRLKAAYAEFEEREMVRLKAENPNQRLSQLKQLLRKEWQKSPDNPFNQT